MLNATTNCILFLFLAVAGFSSCSSYRYIQKIADKELFNDSVLADAHTGIAVYDPSTQKFVYSYQADKYFTPASNMKIMTLYAGLKYLGDSLVAFRYNDTADTVYIQPGGDPTFLHPDFPVQPAFGFLKNCSKPIAVNDGNWRTEALGEGWMWDDYNDGYQVERSPFPVYGNVIKWVQIRDSGSIDALARQEAFIYSEPDINWKVNFSADTAAEKFSVKRALTANTFFITQGKEVHAEKRSPFMTNVLASGLDLLKDSLGKTVEVTTTPVQSGKVLYSQPADSLYRIMMYRSDNFFAEQVLLMAAAEKLGVMDEKALIAYALANEMKELPQKPRWADGSGLSNYNLFTPNDFIWVLHKMKDEYGLERLKKIFPAGGKGTLLNYYKADTAYVYAKTGTLSGVVCLSGYLYTSSGKPLIFSILVNNHMQPAWMIRRKVEGFLNRIAGKK
ncbi:MAG: D-alanyl-D-alanine carboxypeptidase [Chitinophagaceae bacterium]|nr:D-alanyl-D-alanine carboxypeptidase [Chitinophagaceae bacterium]